MEHFIKEDGLLYIINCSVVKAKKNWFVEKIYFLFVLLENGAYAYDC